MFITKRNSKKMLILYGPIEIRKPKYLVIKVEYVNDI